MPQLRTGPAAWSIMEALFKILYVQREKKTYEKNARKNGWFLNMKSLERQVAHSPGTALPQSRKAAC